MFVFLFYIDRGWIYEMLQEISRMVSDWVHINDKQKPIKMFVEFEGTKKQYFHPSNRCFLHGMTINEAQIEVADVGIPL